jgi:hypothetical protein
LYKELFHNSNYINMVVRDMLPMKNLKLPESLDIAKLEIETYYKYISELLSNSSEYHKFSLNL